MRAATTKFRVARPTDQLAALLPFYRDGLGLEVLASFQDHDGFDGVVLGTPGGLYHLEFTSKKGHSVGRAPNPDHLIVFYLPDKAEWEGSVKKMKRMGFDPVPSYNPYWDRNGVTFEDPDGYRVVLQHAAWTA
ncbi:MAG: VOC family protein [Bdellovibrionota bacterium]